MKRQEDWHRLFERSSAARLKTLLEAVEGQPPRSEITRRMLLARLSRAYHDGEALAKKLREASEPARLALRLALDAGVEGIVGHWLENEVLRFHGPASVVSKLYRSGLLLPAASADSWYLGDVQYGYRYVRLFVPPSLAPLLADVEVPGERERWDRNTLAVERPRASGTQPLADTLQGVAAACALVDRCARPRTKAGRLTSRAERVASELAFPDTPHLGPNDWLWLALGFGVVGAHPDGRWLRMGEADLLVDSPLLALHGVPEVLRWVGAMARREYVFETGAFLVPRAPVPVDWEATSMALVWTRALEELHAACGEVVRVGEWFRDDEILAPLRRDLRLRAYAQGGAGQSHTVLEIKLGSAERAVEGLFETLCDLGAFERGRDRGYAIRRLTPYGAILFGPTQPPQFPLLGLGEWTREGRLRCATKDLRELLGVALGGTRAAPEEEGPAPREGFLITPESVARTVREGRAPEALRKWLEDLAGGPPPAPIAAALAEAEGAGRVVASDGVVAVELPGMSDEERARLEARGFLVYGDLVLVQGDPRPLLLSLGRKVERNIDYVVAPDRAAALGNELTLALPPSARRDLRLRAILADFGVEEPLPARVTLAFDEMRGVDGLSDSALERHVDRSLRALQRHLQGPVPDGARLRLRGEAGLLDAPAVEDALVVVFPEPEAKALVELHALDGVAEPLSGGRFLVQPKALGEVEGRLAELGIPFPADRSAVRQTLMARAAVERLQAAVGAVGAVAREPEPAPLPVVPPEPEPEPAPAAPNGLERSVLAALGEAGERGLRLGEVCEAVQAERKDVKAVLQRLIAAETVTLTGRARGARYRVA